MTDDEKNILTERLKSDIVTVKFKKLSGDERVMKCTLQESVIPAATKDDEMSQKKVRAVSLEVCSVWDTEANGWRSFRWDSVISIDS
jgi:hypothetical protein